MNFLIFTLSYSYMVTLEITLTKYVKSNLRWTFKDSLKTPRFLKTIVEREAGCGYRYIIFPLKFTGWEQLKLETIMAEI